MIAAIAFVRSLPWRYIAAAAAAAAVAAAVAAALLGIYHAGGRASDARWTAKAQAQAVADAAAMQASFKEANQFAAKALTQQAQLNTQFATIKGVRRATQNQFTLAAPAPVGTPAPTACPTMASAANTGPVLSLGAVWLWNAALSGQGADLGACRIDAATGQASAACAASSGLTLEAAWDNHAANAEGCATDRLRHQQLIDFLNQRENGATK